MACAVGRNRPAGQPTGVYLMSMTPEQVVRAELDAWSTLDVDQIVAHFAPDAVWVAAPTTTLHGLDQIRPAVIDWVARMVSAELRVIHLAVNGDVVMTERIDSFDYDGIRVTQPLMGVFEIADGKIAAWRDYYVMNNPPPPRSSRTDVGV